ncbi:MAG: hypothetical protein U5S82_23140 [Gammaproteobacteria bacterium]|nr:hypothetical protein [Gammaproteobacteria bacterium]
MDRIAETALLREALEGLEDRPEAWAGFLRERVVGSLVSGAPVVARPRREMQRLALRDAFIADALALLPADMTSRARALELERLSRALPRVRHPAPIHRALRRAAALAPLPGFWQLYRVARATAPMPHETGETISIDIEHPKGDQTDGNI